MPYLNGELTVPVHLRPRPGGLVDDEAVDRHRILGQPDRDDAKVQLGGDLKTHAVEQSPDVRHCDPSRLTRMRCQPVSQRHQASQQLRSWTASDEVEV